MVTGRLTYKPNGDWDRTGEKMMLNVAESGHPVFRGTSPLARGSFQTKRAGKVSIHFNAEPQQAVLFFSHTVPATNQLSIYGAGAFFGLTTGVSRRQILVRDLDLTCFLLTAYRASPMIELVTHGHAAARRGGEMKKSHIF